MKNMLVLPAVVIFLCYLASCCYYDSKEFLYPELGDTCDTTSVTFSGSVQPILQDFCYSCHSNANASFGGNIRLEDYADVKLRADDGSLFGSISHASGYTAMPQGAGKMPDCPIATIGTWIETGSPNN
jgi:hypothetical protein